LRAVRPLPIIFDVFIRLFTFFILFADFGVNFMRQGWRLRTIMWGKKNLYYIYSIKSFIPCLGQMACQFAGMRRGSL